MIFWMFLFILAITTYITNIKNGAGGKANDEILEFQRSDSLIILACMLSTIPLDWIFKHLLPSFYLVGSLISAGFLLMILIIVNIHREALIKKKHDQIVNTFQALADVLGRVDVEDIDFNQVPFTLEEDPKTGNINKITIDMSIPGRFNDNTITLAQYSVNKFFPELQWTSIVDHPKRELTFKGLPKPPAIAKFPGSDYRPTGWIPLGLSGAGEVGWNIADPKKDQMGTSSYIDDEGHTPEAVTMPSAPQCLTLGSTGGGKSIWVGQKIQIKK